MIDLNTPVTSFERAEAYFKAMGCSHFHMHREAPDRYEEYRALEVSKSLERDWTVDEFEQCIAQIEAGHGGVDLWHLHSRANDLYRNAVEKWEDPDFRTSLYERLLGATRIAAEGVEGRDRVILAETILGRLIDHSDGMIVEARNLRDRIAETELFEILHKLLAFNSDDEELELRRKRALDLSYKIKVSSRLRLRWIERIAR